MEQVVTTQPTSAQMPLQAELDPMVEEENEKRRRRREECCCYCTDPEPAEDVFCWYYCCECIGDFFYGIGQCTEACCEGCANSCTDCCDSSPDVPSGGDTDAGCLDCCAAGGDCGDCDCSSD